MAMYLSTIVYLAVAWGAFGLVLALAGRAFGERGLFAAPFAWTAMEFVQSHGSLGFAWHSIANSLAGCTPIVQIVSLTGMFGLSFWAVLVNVLLYRAWRAFAGRAGRAGRRWAVLRALAIAAAVALAPVVHGLVVLARAPSARDGAPTLKVALFQPDIDSNRKWLERDLAYLALMRMAMQLEGDDYDLLVWPETAVPFVLRENPARLDAIEQVVARRGAVLLSGISDRRSTAAAPPDDEGADSPRSRAERIKGAGWRKVNTVHLVRPGSGTLETYEKLHLVPFGEYVPALLGFLEDMMMDVGSGIFVPGEEVRLFDIPVRGEDGERTVVKAATLICLESNFPSLVSRFVTKGADLIVVVANDEWYDGTTQAAQHARIARLRSVEHRLPLLRCANSGITAFIDPYGRMTAARSGRRMVMTGRTSPRGVRTVFSEWGNWFPAGALVITLMLLMVSIAGRRSRAGEDVEP
jgi:apolipoprotein N-acyltransferase